MSSQGAPAGGRFGVRTIVAHDVRLAWRSRTLPALGVTLLLLLAVAGAVGQARFDGESAQRQRYQTLVGEQFADQPDRHPHRVSHYGYLVFRPRAPLGFLDEGIEGYAGTSLFLEAHRQNAPTFSAASQGATGDRLASLTPASVVQFFLPLFVFAVAGVAMTRERELGTLPLLVCQGVSWARLLAGKTLGALAVVSLALLPSLTLVTIWLAITGGTAWSGDVVARAAALVVLNTGFVACCAALAVMVSAWQRTSRAALVTLVGLWFGLWIVLPRVLPVVATGLYPIPARAAFDADIEARVRELGDSHNPDDPVFARLREETLRRYGVDRVQDLPFNYGGFITSEGERVTSAAFREHVARLEAVYRRQDRLVALAAVVSPYVGVRLLSMAVAGSDAAHHAEFERQAEAYRYTLIQALNDLHMNEVAAERDRYGQVVNGAPTRQRIDASFFDSLPTFTYAPPTIGWALRQQATAIAASLAGVVLLMAVWLRLARGRALV